MKWECAEGGHNELHRGTDVRASLAGMLGIALGACGYADAQREGAPGGVVMQELSQVAVDGAWAGLMKPVAIQVAEDGLVYVADRGDGKVRVFTDDGAPVREFGSTGDGPGEFRNVRNLVVAGGTVSVFDTKPTRVLRLSLTGGFQASVGISAFGDEMTSGLGAGRLVFASSARWASPLAVGDAPGHWRGSSIRPV